MSHLELATIIIVAATVVALSLWDAYAKVKQPDGHATVSWVARIFGMRAPILACAVGVVLGHFWWPLGVDCNSPHKGKSTAAPVLGAP